MNYDDVYKMVVWTIIVLYSLVLCYVIHNNVLKAITLKPKCIGTNNR